MEPVLCAELCCDGSFSSSSFEVGVAEGWPSGVVALFFVVKEDGGKVCLPEGAKDM